MNNLDKQYQILLDTILQEGITKKDRTGTGTRSIFGYTIRHNMAEGFPLLTTKKMYTKGIIVELLWFLRGDTNIKFLIENNCHIWNGDALKAYHKHEKEELDKFMKANPYTLVDFQYTPIEEFIDKIKTDDEFAKKWGDLGPSYGKQWRSWGGELVTKRIKEEGKIPYDQNILEGQIDQIANLINDLKTNPDSRRLMVNAWNVADIDSVVLPPCHYGFQVYTRELSNEERNKWNWNVPKEVYQGMTDEQLDKFRVPKRAISLMWNQRSVDTLLGLPFNIASYGLLLTILGQLTNMIPDQLVGNLGDTHLYLNHLEQAAEQITREPFALPKININTEFWQTESGECGIGPLSAEGFLSSLQRDDFCKCLLEEDIQIYDYKSHATIKAELSN